MNIETNLEGLYRPAWDLYLRQTPIGTEDSDVAITGHSEPCGAMVHKKVSVRPWEQDFAFLDVDTIVATCRHERMHRDSTRAMTVTRLVSRCLETSPAVWSRSPSYLPSSAQIVQYQRHRDLRSARASSSSDFCTSSGTAIDIRRQGGKL